MANRSARSLERARAMNPDSAETQRQLALAQSALERVEEGFASTEASGGGPARSAAAERGESESRRPNIALIVVDTLRPDWTTPYGDPRGTSPELARWDWRRSAAGRRA